ncbi:COX assembly mitochondrial -like protein [Trichinella britovi]|uniref:COX assembly mitochondrial protein n=1 Tax=Trichinella britovi TaxID=45882 RepID=A0A0V1DBQ3_TRIBR|nr:COX assembly mitochondrial -like protein [Trichinella sp. T6]KRY58869.1 COX assembly mitochondrial -like protein [Trichinella britovi]
MDKCDQSNHSGINPFPLPAHNDPNDLTLRHVERDTVIPKRVQERVKKEKCKEFYDSLSKCFSQNGFTRIWRCYDERDQLNECLLTWYYNPEFIQECTQQYLNDRSEYRRTGKMSERLRQEKTEIAKAAMLKKKIAKKD